MWFRAESEDERTALVFGFLRHAPVEAGLEPVLASVLGRPVEVGPLSRDNFWPGFPSGDGRVIPDLCFPAAVGCERAVIVVEAKRTSEEHPEGQIISEAVAAARHPSEPSPVVALTVGSRGRLSRDLTLAVQKAVHEGVGEHVRVVHEHVPWSRLGALIRERFRVMPGPSLGYFPVGSI